MSIQMLSIIDIDYSMSNIAAAALIIDQISLSIFLLTSQVKSVQFSPQELRYTHRIMFVTNVLSTQEIFGVQ